jgi:hypothetical protein
VEAKPCIGRIITIFQESTTFYPIIRAIKIFGLYAPDIIYAPLRFLSKLSSYNVRGVKVLWGNPITIKLGE